MLHREGGVDDSPVICPLQSPIGPVVWSPQVVNDRCCSIEVTCNVWNVVRPDPPLKGPTDLRAELTRQGKYAGLEWVVTTMSREDMLRVKKIQKLAVRDETKDLVDALDNLVPSTPQVRRHRSLLRSGRSMTQLLQDVQTEVRKRMQGEGGPQTFLSQSLVAESFECAQCPMAVMSVPSLLILSSSRGFQMLFDAFPDRAFAGQSIIHLVEPSYQSLFQTFFRRVVTYPGEHFSSFVFSMLTRQQTHLKHAPFIVEDCWCQDDTHIFLFLKPMNQDSVASQLAIGGFDVHVDGVYRFDEILSNFDPVRLERCMQEQVADHVETFILRSLCDLWHNAAYDEFLRQVAVEHQVSLARVKSWSTQVFLDVQISDNISRCSVRSRYCLPWHLGHLATDWQNEESIIINESPSGRNDELFSSFWLIDQQDAPDASVESFNVQEFCMRKVKGQHKCYCTRIYSLSCRHISIRGRTFQSVHRPGLEYAISLLPVRE
eukprot:757971-Hanusia_phi.AAC.4